MSKKIVVEVLNQSFKVYGNFDKILFFKRLLQTFEFIKVRGKTIRKLDKDFFIRNDLKQEAYLPLNILPKFIAIIGKDKIEFKDKRYTVDETIELNMKNGIEPRDYQIPFIEEMVKDSARNVILNLDTGRGKTITSAITLSRIKKRFMVYVLARYVDKWVDDCLDKFDITRDEIYVIDDKKTVNDFLSLSEEEVGRYKIFISSNRKFHMYLKTYLKILDDSLFGYPLTPPEIFKKFKINTLLIDEVHQEFESMFRSIVLFNPPKVIALSATLETKDKDLNKIYKIMYPESLRLKEEDSLSFRTIMALSYKVYQMKPLNISTSKGYNHTMFEKEILKRPSVLREYLKMIGDQIEELYIKRMTEKGQKCLVYAARKEMIYRIVEYIKIRFKDKGFKISQYITGDAYEDIMKSDITVSTLGKSSTALDIKNLITIIQTISVSGLQPNKQSLGRLRPIDGIEVIYAYLYSMDVRPHRSHHRYKCELFVNAKKYICKDIPYVFTFK